VEEARWLPALLIIIKRAREPAEDWSTCCNVLRIYLL
jgi:hypothetical protein